MRRRYKTQTPVAPSHAAKPAWAPDMYINPAGETPGFVFSVLRRRFCQREVGISASEFVRRKLYPIDRPPEGGWSPPPTCLRHDVLLPPGAVDAFLDVRALLDAYEKYLPAWRSGLLCVLKVPQSVNQPLHASYERIRMAARNAFPLARGCPAIVIEHATLLTGSSRQPHCHILACGAALGLLGFARFCDDITSDVGHLTLYQEFAAAGALEPK